MTYMICDADGHEARAIAQRKADDRDESVWLSESDSEDVGEEIAPRAVAWWAWHDQDSARQSGTMDEAEARCAAWLAGESTDGPADAEV